MENWKAFLKKIKKFLKNKIIIIKEPGYHPKDRRILPFPWKNGFLPW